jgi:hypothetical protein
VCGPSAHIVVKSQPLLLVTISISKALTPKCQPNIAGNGAETPFKGLLELQKAIACILLLILNPKGLNCGSMIEP